MAASTGWALPVKVGEKSCATTHSDRRRFISQSDARALEILDHAIEYLADEYVNGGRTFCADDPEVQAVQLLMALNREIYLECPIVPTFVERIRACLQRSKA
jgi:hypothetical protein